MSRIRVGILFGGRSAEHEVSILSARNILVALDRERFDPVLIAIDKGGRWLLPSEATLLQTSPDPRLARVDPDAPTTALQASSGGALATPGGPLKLDVVFPVLHGPMGEDGTVQGLLELAGIPYVGAGVLGSAVGMDKDVMKRLLRERGLPVVPFEVIRRGEFRRDPERACERAAKVGFPLFTKPANMGSSVGVRRVPGQAQLTAALAHALEFDQKSLAEAAVPGAREIEVSVLGSDLPEASEPGEIVVRHPDGFYSYDAKYVDESGAELLIPARLEEAQRERVRAFAVAVFQTLECHGLARVDFLLSDRGEFYVNEINTLPGFTRISMFPKLWEHQGLSQTALVTRLVELALERDSRKKELRCGG
jgi:D-alanine-D-alanine ligase